MHNARFAALYSSIDRFQQFQHVVSPWTTVSIIQIHWTFHACHVQRIQTQLSNSFARTSYNQFWQTYRRVHHRMWVCLVMRWLPPFRKAYFWRCAAISNNLLRVNISHITEASNTQVTRFWQSWRLIWSMSRLLGKLCVKNQEHDVSAWKWWLWFSNGLFGLELKRLGGFSCCPSQILYTQHK